MLMYCLWLKEWNAFKRVQFTIHYDDVVKRGRGRLQKRSNYSLDQIVEEGMKSWRWNHGEGETFEFKSIEFQEDKSGKTEFEKLEKDKTY